MTTNEPPPSPDERQAPTSDLPGYGSGTGMAIAGIATGAVGIVVFVIIIALVATGAVDTSFTVDS